MNSVFSFSAIARQVSAAAPDGMVSYYVSDGYSDHIVSLPLTAQNETHGTPLLPKRHTNANPLFV
jgi:hypothetical protein